MVTNAFQKELEASLFVHRALPLHREKSLEAKFPQKKVLKTRTLWAGEPVTLAGYGEITYKTESGEPVLSVTLPTRADHWPEGAPADGDYVNFGAAKVRLFLDREDWRGYNRLHFFVRADLNGARLYYMDANLKSEGEIPVPDPYYREGHHSMELQNGAWQELFWEFNAMGRDAVTMLEFSIPMIGGDAFTGEDITVAFKNITLEQVETPETECGWQCRENTITYSTVGYFPTGKKIAVANVTASEFALVSAETNEIVYRAPVETVKNERGTFNVLDFTAYQTPGTYILRAGEAQTEPFLIADGLTEESVWRAVNFLYGERCGMPVPGRHGTCHQDIIAEHNGVKISYSGGWHDAGDVSQQTLQSAEVVHALLETASHCDKTSALYTRLLEEAEWGLDFVLRTRFGDGYRATSAGLTRYTNNKIGDMDDVQARVFNHAFENFTFAAVEAYAAVQFKDADPGIARGSLRAAKEDFAFAMARYQTHGAEQEQMYEHTYNSGASQHYAVIVWAASNLYAASEEETYAETARNYAEKLLKCQETGAAGLPFTGFFYRDETHKAIVHFNHQSREQQFAQALAALYETQPNAPEAETWRAAMRRLGDYLLYISGNTAPYGMLPAGVHRLDEPEDRETFPYLHVLCDYDTEKANYIEQLKHGTPIDANHVLKNFPVWFSFRGNTAILLAMGKSASLLGRVLKNDRLTQLGREQFYWMWGKNPFGQSLIYGAGTNYCSQYSALCGELAGEMPVGVETLGNTDLPYWPQTNNATYKEIWTSAVSRWLWLAADFTDE